MGQLGSVPAPDFPGYEGLGLSGLFLFMAELDACIDNLSAEQPMYDALTTTFVDAIHAIEVQLAAVQPGILKT